VGGTPLNLWEVLRKCRKACDQGVLRTPHHQPPRGVLRTEPPTFRTPLKKAAVGVTRDRGSVEGAAGADRSWNGCRNARRASPNRADDALDQAVGASEGARISLAADQDPYPPLEVLRLLRGSLSKREIGQELFLSYDTIHTHTQSIYRKLGVSSRAEAVEEAKSRGIL
jgi:DNA-binding CsgD family transcriptional regulator